MTWVAVLLGVLGCALAKLAGASVPARVLEDVRVRRVALLLPVGLLAALTATQALTRDGGLVLDARVPAVAVAVVALLLRAPFLVVVALAAGTAALVRAVA